MKVISTMKLKPIKKRNASVERRRTKDATLVLFLTSNVIQYNLNMQEKGVHYSLNQYTKYIEPKKLVRE